MLTTRAADSPSCDVLHTMASIAMPASAGPNSMPASLQADLGFAALISLPVPILILSVEYTVVLANTAVHEIFSSQGHAKDGRSYELSYGPNLKPNALLGSNISLLGFSEFSSLEDSEIDWPQFLRGLSHHESSSNPHRLDVMLRREYNTGFTISASKITLTGNIFFSLTLMAPVIPSISHHKIKETAAAPRIQDYHSFDSKDQLVNAVSTLQMAVFDSFTEGVFLLSVDEKVVVFNRAASEFVGADAINAIQNDGEAFLRTFPTYDVDFTQRVPVSERPGVRCVRTKQNIPEHLLGFINSKTEAKIVMRLSAEVLYHANDGSVVGCICRIRQPQNLNQYKEQQRQNLIESFQTICNVMPHMVWRTDTKGNCDYFSQRWYDYTGLSEAESTNAAFSNVVHHEDVSILYKNFSASIIASKECTTEARYRRHDGVYRWMLVRAVPFIYDGQVLAWYGTNTDIHEHVMSRITNRRTKDQMLSVLSHAEVSLFAVNLDGVFTMAEGDMAWNFGTKSDTSSVVGTSLMELPVRDGDIESRNVFQKHIQNILDGTEILSVSEYVIGDRTYRTRLIADKTGAENSCTAEELVVKGALGVSIDISDLKARVQLEIQNASLQLEEQTAQRASRMKSQFLANMSHEMRTPLAGVIGLVDLLSDTSLDTEQIEFLTNIRLSSSMLLGIVNDVLDFSKVESGHMDVENVQFNLAENITGLCRLLRQSAHQKGLVFQHEVDIPEDLAVMGDPGRIRQILMNLLTNAIKFTKEGTVTLSASIRQYEHQIIARILVQDTGIGIEKLTLSKLFQPFRQGDSSTARLYGGTGLGLAISKNLALLMKGSLELESLPSIGTRAILFLPLGIFTAKHEQIPSFPHPAGPTSIIRPANDMTPQLIAPHQKTEQSDIHAVQAEMQAVFSTMMEIEQKKLSSNAISEQPNTNGGVQVLVVEDKYATNISFWFRRSIIITSLSPINQTIALKTIKKLGYTAAAVWNGSEALGYLSSCIASPGTESRPASPTGSTTLNRPSLPAVILMDVQMPVLDGYNATRTIRTIPPFADNADVQKIPIIALTASAIQGDHEKCLKAGMNDYLTKPVSRDLLAIMLEKWGLQSGKIGV